ncbi:Uncharacterised protein [Sphingobacterium spiritivorum]|uniref:Uncharacterized protein n=1 Tax=Sphingobacterium spiritivorum TaxID=258 RepID=A0A380CMX2_SPHSI|nr:hypothetical protein [Sphingobacterium spiritivorum]SUJ24645.1 Uncharacterised protein [Sphingobacterium spiritivorum]
MMIGELIAKEELPNYKIIPAPVDHSELLKDKLEGALRLGNAFKSKNYNCLPNGRRTKTYRDYYMVCYG